MMSDIYNESNDFAELTEQEWEEFLAVWDDPQCLEAWEEEEEDYPEDITLEIGFDPYAGCYTYDC